MRRADLMQWMRAQRQHEKLFRTTTRFQHHPTHPKLHIGEQGVTALPWLGTGASLQRRGGSRSPRGHFTERACGAPSVGCHHVSARAVVWTPGPPRLPLHRGEAGRRAGETWPMGLAVSCLERRLGRRGIATSMFHAVALRPRHGGGRATRRLSASWSDRWCGVSHQSVARAYPYTRRT